MNTECVVYEISDTLSIAQHRGALIDNVRKHKQGDIQSLFLILFLDKRFQPVFDLIQFLLAHGFYLSDADHGSGIVKCLEIIIEDLIRRLLSEF